MGFETTSTYSPVGRDEDHNDELLTTLNSTSRSIVDAVMIFISVLTASAAFGFIVVLIIQPGSPKSSAVNPCANPPIRREWRSLKTYEREEYLSAHTSMLNFCLGIACCYIYTNRNYANTVVSEASYRPYWDWTSDWQNLTESSIWEDKLGFGGESTHYTHGSCVSGPFSHVKLLYGRNGTVSPHCLSRVFTNYDSGEVGSMSGELIRPEIMGRLSRSKDYARFRWMIESVVHNIIHTEVVGDLDTEVAPNDPIFWLHHVQLDRLWWLWQREAPQQRLSDYKQHKSELQRPTSLRDMLQYNGLAEGARVDQVMDTGSSILCYRYRHAVMVTRLNKQQASIAPLLISNYRVEPDRDSVLVVTKMSSYLPVKQKTEEESEHDEILLSQSSTEIGESDGHDDNSAWNQRGFTLRRWNLTEIGLVLFIVVSNLLWFLSSRTWTQSTLRDADYFGNPDKILVSFDHDWTDIQDGGISGSRYADDKWKGVFPTLGSSVALTGEFVRKHGLPPSVRSPEQSDKFIYQIAGYHQLHCLYEIRKQLYDPGALSSLDDKVRRDHILHCVEAVRQALYCFLDPTLINLEPKWPHVPNGQRHVCRNRDALRAWTEKHGHSLPED
ncbi:hypothetical protein O1611_g2173 [Lasiodiplodia mahajangana]|uniref:Uncharacterized protein n=1 Tax=Lasiodiplodia mahajangana TaxID=1108764 RepID=A0ACC2JW02_9PEZI|nr:hypothetical protein O1611_g2173 [Lasiodiplodia mahajangana]